MSKTIIPAMTWSPLDIDEICRLQEQTKTGTWVRQGNRVAAVRALVNALNHLLAQSPRILFQQGQSYAARSTGDGTPVYQWRFQDQVTNERTHVYQIVAAKRALGDGESYAQREGDATVKTPDFADESVFGTFPEDTYFTGMSRARGNPTAAPGYDNEGITTVEEFSIVDVCVYTKPLQALEISIHDYCPSVSSPGSYVVANILELVRSKFFELREHCLPVLFSWAAQGGAAAWATPASTDMTGIVVTSTTDVNILDQSFTTRSATSPGFIFDVYRCGAGIDTRVPIEVSLLAAKADGVDPGDASFTVVGPDHVASNNASVTNVTGSSATWYDLATNVYGATESAATDVTSERNKVDAFAHVADGDTLYIYSVQGRMRWAI